MHLPGLIELKIAAGRLKDQADVVELLRANPSELPAIRQHIVGVHPDYNQTLNRLAEQALREDVER